MNITKSTLSTIIYPTVALLFVACTNMNTIPKKTLELEEPLIVEKRAQELVITTDTTSATLQEKTQYQYTINLNNTTKNEAILVLKNRGEKLLTIAAINLTDPSHLLKSSHDCNRPLAAEESCNLNIKFTGQEKGRFTSTLKILSNDTEHKTTNIIVNIESRDKLHGSVKSIKSLQVEQERTLNLKFNALNKTQYIQVENDGFKILSLNAPKRSGEDADSFRYTTDCPVSLKVGEKCEVAITYDSTKKEGYSDATIIIPSNANITPSRYIRLEGYSKPFSVKINKFVISDNVDDFLDDYFESSKTYYFRTIYQENTDRFFTNAVKSEITQYFKANNFKLADSAASADRVVTIYPSVKSIKNKETNDIEYTIGINGYLTTKAKKVKVSSTEDSITLDYKSQVADTQFSAIRLNNTIFAKEKFKFSMGIQVNNAADDKEVAETVADLVVSKLFNVLGLQDTK